MGQIVFGLYKLNGMGLLPVYASDWVSSLKVCPLAASNCDTRATAGWVLMLLGGTGWPSRASCADLMALEAMI
jgi:hypothetical protein